MIDFSAQLRDCFPEYPVPSDLLMDRTLADCDSADASLLLGVCWTRVDPDFWLDNWSAASALSPNAFVYYLPSMLEFSIDDPYELIREFLICIFNTSGDQSIFSDFILNIINLLDIIQVRTLNNWGEILKKLGYFSNSTEEDRVIFTLMKIEEMKSGITVPRA